MPDALPCTFILLPFNIQLLGSVQTNNSTINSSRKCNNKDALQLKRFTDETTTNNTITLNDRCYHRQKKILGDAITDIIEMEWESWKTDLLQTLVECSYLFTSSSYMKPEKENVSVGYRLSLTTHRKRTILKPLRNQTFKRC